MSTESDKNIVEKMGHDFVERLKLRYKVKSSKGLGSILDVHPNTVRNWEKTLPPQQTVLDCAKKSGLSPDYLLLGDYAAHERFARLIRLLSEVHDRIVSSAQPALLSDWSTELASLEQSVRDVLHGCNADSSNSPDEGKRHA